MSHYVTVKVNVSGSWANLVTCDPARYVDVKMACEQIAKACIGQQIAFKASCNGEVIEQYSHKPKAGEPFGWYDPRNR